MSEKPLRILGVGNGRSINFLRWGRRLGERGHEVHLASDRFSAVPAELEGLEPHAILELEPLLRVRGVRRLRFGRALGNLARDLDVDLVHAHSLLPYGYWAAGAGAHPFVLSPWGTDVLVRPWKSRRWHRWATTAIAEADYLVVNSAANESASVRLGADAARMRRIIWYAELDRFVREAADPGLRARFGWPDDALIVLSLRNYRRDTNLDVALRAFAGVHAAEPRARLVLAARTGPLKDELEELAADLGLAEVVAFHRAEWEDLPALVASADVLVSLPASDSTPASLLEAMASGLPAVCGIAPSIDEWVGQGDGAELVPCRDEGAVAAALLGLLRDPDRRRAYGERNARAVREKIGDPGAELEQLYRELLAA